MAGEKCDLSNDDLILNINSPKKSVGGPYKVIHKDQIERWAIVALDWGGDPRLGIRWFVDTKGNPTIEGQPTWFVLPPNLYISTLNGLPLTYQDRKEVERFLMGEITGEELGEEEE